MWTLRLAAELWAAAGLRNHTTWHLILIQHPLAGTSGDCTNLQHDQIELQQVQQQVVLSHGLHRLSLPAAVASAAPPVTRLQDFDDLALVKLVYSLTGLEQLSIPDNPVTDVALLVIGQHLQQLTELVLDGCEQITDVGVQQLMGLPSLQVFDDDGTHISPEVLASMYIFVARNRCEALETRH